MALLSGVSFKFTLMWTPLNRAILGPAVKTDIVYYIKSFHKPLNVALLSGVSCIN